MALLQATSDIDHGSGGNAVNKYGAGGGASPHSTWYEGLATKNQDTAWVGNSLEGGAADFALAVGMPTIAPDKIWNVYINGTVDVFNADMFEVATQFYLRIVDSAGNAFDGTPVTISGAGGQSMRDQWVDQTFQVDATGAPAATGQTANSCILHVLATGDNPAAYWGITYFAIEIATFTVTVSSDANSAWDQEGAVEVNPGEDLTLTLTPANGYKVLDVELDDVSVGDAAGESSYELVIEDIDANHTVEGTAAQPSDPAASPSVTATHRGGSGGTITANVSEAVPGQTVRYRIAPGQGQRIVVLEIDEDDVSQDVDPLTSEPYQDAMDAGEPIEYDYIMPVGDPVVHAEFDRAVPVGLGSVYDGGSLTSGMTHESLASAQARQDQRKQREREGQY